MIHVGAVQERCLLVVDEWVEADGAVCVPSLHGLALDALPSLAQLVRLAPLLTHGKRALFLLVESSLNIREERLE